MCFLSPDQQCPLVSTDRSYLTIQGSSSNFNYYHDARLTRWSIVWHCWPGICYCTYVIPVDQLDRRISIFLPEFRWPTLPGQGFTEELGLQNKLLPSCGIAVQQPRHGTYFWCTKSGKSFYGWHQSRITFDPITQCDPTGGLWMCFTPCSNDISGSLLCFLPLPECSEVSDPATDTMPVYFYAVWDKDALVA